MSSSQRSKEDAMDYRYFPEPDILELNLDEAFLEECRSQIVELPVKKRLRYLQEYKLKEDDARLLTADHALSEYFEELVALTDDPQKACSYITSVLLALINDRDDVTLDTLKFDIGQLAQVIKLVNSDELSSTNAKYVIEQLFENGGKTDIIVDENNLRQKNDMQALEAIVDAVLAENQSQLAEYKAGKENLFGYFVGQCMKASK